VNRNNHDQGCKNPRLQVTVATKFCMVVPNVCGSSVGNMLCVTLLPPRNLRWLIHFWKTHAPLILTQFKVLSQHLPRRTEETDGKPQLQCLLLTCNFVFLCNRSATYSTGTLM
jgi:hypothetical protein